MQEKIKQMRANSTSEAAGAVCKINTTNNKCSFTGTINPHLCEINNTTGACQKKEKKKYICRLNIDSKKRPTCEQIEDIKCKSGFYNTTNDKKYQEILKKRGLNIKRVRCYTKPECNKNCGISTKHTIEDLSYKMLKGFSSIKDLFHNKNYKTLRLLLKKSMDYPLKGELLKLKKEIDKFNNINDKKILKGHTSNIFSLVVLPNGDLASGSRDKTIRIWDTTSGKCKKELKGHTSDINSLVVLPNGDLVSGSDLSIRIWDTTSGKCKKELKGHTSRFISLVVLPNGDLASCPGDKTIRIWDTTSGKSKKILKGHTYWINSLVVLPNGDLASGSRDKTIRIWDTTSGKFTELKGHNGPIFSLVVLPNGDLASGSSDHTIRIWDTTSGKCKKELKGHTDSSIQNFVVLSNGDLASSGSRDFTIRIWNTTSGKCKQELKGHTDSIQNFVVLSNGDLASGSVDYTIRIWDTTSGKCKKELKGHTGNIKSLVVLPNGDLASGSYDKTIRIWSSTINTKLLYGTQYDIEEAIKKNTIEHINKLIYSRNINLNKIKYYISLTGNLKIKDLLNDYLKSNLRVVQKLIKKEKKIDLTSLINEIEKLNKKKYKVKYVKTCYQKYAPFKIEKTITKYFSKKDFKNFIK